MNVIISDGNITVDKLSYHIPAVRELLKQAPHLPVLTEVVIHTVTKDSTKVSPTKVSPTSTSVNRGGNPYSYKEFYSGKPHIY